MSVQDYSLKDIPLESIETGERIREDLGNINTLARDIEKHGVITPITVIDRQAAEELEMKSDRPYLLAAGKRRLEASKKAGLEHIAAKVYERQISEWELKVIELLENEDRKEMTPYEQACSRAEIHRLHVEKYGKKGRGDKEGVAAKDTAELMGTSSQTVRDALKIADLGKEFKEVREADSKNEALAFIKKKKQELAAEEKKKRLEEKREKQKETGKIEIEGKDEDEKTELQENLADRYLVGNYFEQIQELPDGSIDLLELDPDWGIDFLEARSDRNDIDTYNGNYHEVEPEAYEQTFREILQAAKPKMKDHSWVIVWYSLEEWHEATWRILDEEGFTAPKMPAFWIKSSGNTATPAYRLGEGATAFYYARQGNCRIQNMGRSNLFQFPTLRGDNRFHQAEKPIELYEEIFETFVQEGDVVVSGFAGSGNALLAAENLKINSVGFDLSEVNKQKFEERVYSSKPGNYSSYS